MPDRAVAGRALKGPLTGAARVLPGRKTRRGSRSARVIISDGECHPAAAAARRRGGAAQCQLAGTAVRLCRFAEGMSTHAAR
jgi:hypothetical protein